MGYRPPIPAEFPACEGVFFMPRRDAPEGAWHIFKERGWWKARQVGTDRAYNMRSLDELLDLLEVFA